MSWPSWRITRRQSMAAKTQKPPSIRYASLPFSTIMSASSRRAFETALLCVSRPEPRYESPQGRQAGGDAATSDVTLHALDIARAAEILTAHSSADFNRGGFATPPIQAGARPSCLRPPKCALERLHLALIRRRHPPREMYARHVT